MFGGKPTKPQNRIDSLIGEGTTVEGNVVFSGGLRIDGQVKGNVLAAGDQPSTLVLSERARVEGEIRVSHAVVNGTVHGPVYAMEYVELQAKCNVTGDVHYKTLEIQLGAVVQGRLVHHEEVQAPRMIALKPAQVEAGAIDPMLQSDG
jgi:cytoskeletal protein CcmA (bactofilin family)